MEQTQQPPAVAPERLDEPQRLDEIVERWWQDHFPGSPVAQVTTAWNHALAAKDELKRRLGDFMKGGQ